MNDISENDINFLNLWAVLMVKSYVRFDFEIRVIVSRKTLLTHGCQHPIAAAIRMI